MPRMKVRIKAKPFLEILAKKNRSQNGFAQAIDLTSGHFSQLVTGRRNVSATTREKILSVLDGVKFDDIFFITFRK